MSLHMASVWQQLEKFLWQLYFWLEQVLLPFCAQAKEFQLQFTFNMLFPLEEFYFFVYILTHTHTHRARATATRTHTLAEQP